MDTSLLPLSFFLSFFPLESKLFPNVSFSCELAFFFVFLFCFVLFASFVLRARSRTDEGTFDRPCSFFVVIIRRYKIFQKYVDSGKIFFFSFGSIFYLVLLIEKHNRKYYKQHIHLYFSVDINLLFFI